MNALSTVLPDLLVRTSQERLQHAVSNGSGPCHFMADLPSGRVSLCGVKRFHKRGCDPLSDYRPCAVCKPCARRLRAIERAERRRTIRPTEAPRRSPDVDAVAEIYLEAAHAGRSPTADLTEQFGISQQYAYQLIAKARRSRKLPPAARTIRRIGKAVAVAEALGVPYEVLVLAIREHASGVLNVGRTEMAARP